MKREAMLLALWALAWPVCRAAMPPAPFTGEQVASLIAAGALGPEFAERARKAGDLHVRDVSPTNIPFQVFAFSDYRAGYSVLVEGGRLVLLCSGFGGGDAFDLRMEDRDGRSVLTYKFHVGSGIQRKLSGEYVLGSGKAEWPGPEAER